MPEDKDQRLAASVIVRNAAVPVVSDKNWSKKTDFKNDISDSLSASYSDPVHATDAILTYNVKSRNRPIQVNNQSELVI